MKHLTNETIEEISANNFAMSILLRENENLYLNELSDFERRIYNVGKDSQIELPLSYIRPLDHFIDCYNLASITDNIQHQENIAQLMQYDDLIHFIFTRFKINHELQCVHYYYNMINLASILEVVIKELADKYRKICIHCPKSKKLKCNNIINKEDMKDLKIVLKKLKILNIITIDENDLDRLYNLIDLRNNVHLRLMTSKFNENSKYSTKNYNSYMATFQKLIQNIHNENIKCSIN